LFCPARYRRSGVRDTDAGQASNFQNQAEAVCRQLVAIHATGRNVAFAAKDFLMTIPIATESQACEVSPDLASLSIMAADGSSITLTAQKLRLFCKCAHCTRARFDERFPDRFPGIAIVEVADLGYGLNICFSDGHNRGIYPNSYLASLADD
jgi:DUF971 family protein